MKDKKVLLLEAGEEDNHPFIKMPAAMVKLFTSPYVYKYHSTPQAHKDNGTIFIPQGKGLGGSSSVNAMAYLRGSAYDYDSWGFPEWSYDKVLPYFEKSIHPQGPWRIAVVKNPHPLTQRVIAAVSEELGLPIAQTFNSERLQTEGVGLLQVNIADGARNSISDAFLSKEVLARDNLFVRTSTEVHKLVFAQGATAGSSSSSGGKRVQGVLVSGGDTAAAGPLNSPTPIHARTEVIVSSGTITSPRLLMVSGIGPPSLLAAHKIPLVHANECVGAGLQDHPVMFMTHLLKDSSLSLDALSTFPWNALKFLQWLVWKDNELANCAEMTGYIRSGVARRGGEAPPDLQVGFIKAIYLDHGKAGSGGRSGYALGPILLSPASKGSVAISGPKLSDPPVIDFGLFSDPKGQDFERVVEGCKALQRVLRGPRLGEVNGEGGFLIPEPTPLGCTEDAWLRSQVKKHTNTLYHPIGTCGMGRVVDDRLRVMGVQGLRVVDASVIPVIPRANTNAPTVMLAEKASDFIKEEATGGRGVV
jgi:choline dehydrogenase